MMRIVLILLITFTGLQNNIAQKTLSYNDFIQIVQNHHPVCYQIKLLNDKNEAYELKAKSFIDPTIAYNFDHKAFENKNYYAIHDGMFKLPTWLGADVKLGYENNSGEFLDESDSLPNNGLLAPGISIPLGNGLLFNERRHALQEAKIIAQENTNKQQLIYNELVFEAGANYLKWQAAQEIVTRNKGVVEVARVRYKNTVQSYVNGDIPAIDTIESLINYQARQESLIKSEQDLNEIKNKIENYLWSEAWLPIELENDVIPEVLDIKFGMNTTDSLSMTNRAQWTVNPIVDKYRIEKSFLELDERLLKENLKPDLEVSYSSLINLDQNNLVPNTLRDDYKMSVSFYYPLFNRKDRANLKLNKIEIETMEMEIKLAENKLTNEIDNHFQMEFRLRDQIKLLADNVERYQFMLEAEEIKFELGESSLFLINSRESKLLESQIKLVKLQKDLLFIRTSLRNLFQLEEFRAKS